MPERKPFFLGGVPLNAQLSTKILTTFSQPKIQGFLPNVTFEKLEVGSILVAGIFGSVPNDTGSEYSTSCPWQWPPFPGIGYNSSRIYFVFYILSLAIFSSK